MDHGARPDHDAAGARGAVQSRDRGVAALEPERAAQRRVSGRAAPEVVVWCQSLAFAQAREEDEDELTGGMGWWICGAWEEY